MDFMGFMSELSVNGFAFNSKAIKGYDLQTGLQGFCVTLLKSIATSHNVFRF